MADTPGTPYDQSSLRSNLKRVEDSGPSTPAGTSYKKNTRFHDGTEDHVASKTPYDRRVTQAIVAPHNRRGQQSVDSYYIETLERQSAPIVPPGLMRQSVKAGHTYQQQEKMRMSMNRSDDNENWEALDGAEALMAAYDGLTADDPRQNRQSRALLKQIYSKDICEELYGAPAATTATIAPRPNYTRQSTAPHRTVPISQNIDNVSQGPRASSAAPLYSRREDTFHSPSSTSASVAPITSYARPASARQSTVQQSAATMQQSAATMRQSAATLRQSTAPISNRLVSMSPHVPASPQTGCVSCSRSNSDNPFPDPIPTSGLVSPTGNYTRQQSVVTRDYASGAVSPTVNYYTRQQSAVSRDFASGRASPTANCTRQQSVVSRDYASGVASPTANYYTRQQSAAVSRDFSNVVQTPLDATSRKTYMESTVESSKGGRGTKQQLRTSVTTTSPHNVVTRKSVIATDGKDGYSIVTTSAQPQRSQQQQQELQQSLQIQSQQLQQQQLQVMMTSDDSTANDCYSNDVSEEQNVFSAHSYAMEELKMIEQQQQQQLQQQAQKQKPISTSPSPNVASRAGPGTEPASAAAGAASRREASQSASCSACYDPDKIRKLREQTHRPSSAKGEGAQKDDRASVSRTREQCISVPLADRPPAKFCVSEDDQQGLKFTVTVRQKTS